MCTYLYSTVEVLVSVGIGNICATFGFCFIGLLGFWLVDICHIIIWS